MVWQLDRERVPQQLSKERLPSVSCSACGMSFVCKPRCGACVVLEVCKTMQWQPNTLTPSQIMQIQDSAFVEWNPRFLSHGGFTARPKASSPSTPVTRGEVGAPEGDAMIRLKPPDWATHHPYPPGFLDGSDLKMRYKVIQTHRDIKQYSPTQLACMGLSRQPTHTQHALLSAVHWESADYAMAVKQRVNPFTVEQTRLRRKFQSATEEQKAKRARGMMADNDDRHHSHYKILKDGSQINYWAAQRRVDWCAEPTSLTCQGWAQRAAAKEQSKEWTRLENLGTTHGDLLAQQTQAHKAYIVTQAHGQPGSSLLLANREHRCLCKCYFFVDSINVSVLNKQV
jgi:hypothetical protein